MGRDVTIAQEKLIVLVIGVAVITAIGASGNLGKFTDTGLTTTTSPENVEYNLIYCKESPIETNAQIDTDDEVKICTCSNGPCDTEIPELPTEIITDLIQDLPPGNYLIGPEITEQPVAAEAGGTKIHTSRQWERTIIENQTLDITMQWNEVGAGSEIGPQARNEATLHILKNGEEHATEPIFRTPTEPQTYTYKEPGTYTITLTGKQGITEYDISIEENLK